MFLTIIARCVYECDYWPCLICLCKVWALCCSKRKNHQMSVVNCFLKIYFVNRCFHVYQLLLIDFINYMIVASYMN